MNSTHKPGPTWTQIGLQLAAIRATARREKRRYGGLTERTQARLREAMAKADAALAIDDVASDSRTAR